MAWSLLGTSLWLTPVLGETVALPEQSGESFSYNPNGKRDPFRSLAHGPLTPTEQENPHEIFLPVLYGILYDVKQPIALIDDEELREGDSIRDFKVEEIRKDSVILLHGEERIKLEIVF